MSRFVALSWLDRIGSLLAPHSECVRQLARRREMASQLLPDVWVFAFHGSVGWGGTRSATRSFVWLLWHALGISTIWVSVLRKQQRSAARGSGNRRRWGPPH